jgi:predicted dehydrogenase
VTRVRVALIGTGAVAVQNHIPGIRLHPLGEVAVLCDADAHALERAGSASGVADMHVDPALSGAFRRQCRVIATPLAAMLPARAMVAELVIRPTA